MSDARDFFPSRFFRGGDLLTGPRVFAIAAINFEQIGNEHKPVVTFVGEQKKWTLNKVNNEQLIRLFGFETTKWIGQSIELYHDQTMYAGQLRDCIRVRQVSVQPVPAVPPVAESPPSAELDWEQ